MEVRLKSEKDIRGLELSGAILAAVLHSLKEKAAVGVHLSELDNLARELIKKAGAEPAFLGYKPNGASKAYPAAICTSVNDTVVHGQPSKYKLRDGDILKIDLGVRYHGYFTDGAITVGIGRISEGAKQLLVVTEEALEQAIRECQPSNRLGDIGWAVENTVRRGGFSVVKGLTGHGIGFALHEEPDVYNYGNKEEGLVLRPGLVLAIEPMVAVGSGEVRQKPDDSFVTRDGSVSAHFEHTVAVTEAGPKILTKL